MFESNTQHPAPRSYCIRTENLMYFFCGGSYLYMHDFRKSEDGISNIVNGKNIQKIYLKDIASFQPSSKDWTNVTTLCQHPSHHPPISSHILRPVLFGSDPDSAPTSKGINSKASGRVSRSVGKRRMFFKRVLGSGYNSWGARFVFFSSIFFVPKG